MFRIILLALVVQLASLANVVLRKSYNGQHEKQAKLRHEKNDLTREIDPLRWPLDNPPNDQLSLSGKFEPPSDLPTINLPAQSSGKDTNAGKSCGGKPLCG